MTNGGFIDLAAFANLQEYLPVQKNIITNLESTPISFSNTASTQNSGIPIYTQPSANTQALAAPLQATTQTPVPAVTEALALNNSPLQATNQAPVPAVTEALALNSSPFQTANQLPANTATQQTATTTNPTNNIINQLMQAILMVVQLVAQTFGTNNNTPTNN